MKKILIFTFLFIFICSIYIFATDEVPNTINDSGSYTTLYSDGNNEAETSDEYGIALHSNSSSESTSVDSSEGQASLHSSTIVTEKKTIQAEDFLTADNILLIILSVIGLVIIFLGIAVLIRTK